MPVYDGAMAKLRWVATERTFAAATVEDLYLEYWYGHSEAQDFNRQGELQRAFVDELPGKRFVSLSYVGMSTFKPPGAEAREALMRNRRDLAARGGGTAIVLPSRGFLAATLRAILAGLNLVRGGGGPQAEIFSTVAEASGWLGERSKALVASAIETLANEFVTTVQAQRAGR
jgi:hypothetical protein